MSGKTTYKFRLARVETETCELAMPFESTWEMIQRNVTAGFPSHVKDGGIRHLTIVRSSSLEKIGDNITDAAMFWLALVKWYDASTVFMVYDNTPVDLSLQLQSTASPTTRVSTPYMGRFEELVDAVCKTYPYITPPMIKHFSAVKDGHTLGMQFLSADELWAWYDSAMQAQVEPRFVIAAPSMDKLEVASSLFTEKFILYAPADCSLDLLNVILKDTVLKLKGLVVEIESVAVRSLRGSEDLSSTSQLSTLVNVTNAWLYVTMRPTGTAALLKRSGPVATVRSIDSAVSKPSSIPTGQSFTVRFCLRGDQSVQCTVKLAQGGTFDDIKAAVASKCSGLEVADIKHFILLDKDGDDFSSGLDTVTKFWRIAQKYFKDPTVRDFVLNIILADQSASGVKPSIIPDPAAEAQEQTVEPVPVPVVAPAPVPVPVVAPVPAPVPVVDPVPVPVPVVAPAPVPVPVVAPAPVPVPVVDPAPAPVPVVAPIAAAAMPASTLPPTAEAASADPTVSSTSIIAVAAEETSSPVSPPAASTVANSFLSPSISACALDETSAQCTASATSPETASSVVTDVLISSSESTGNLPQPGTSTELESSHDKSTVLQTDVAKPVKEENNTASYSINVKLSDGIRMLVKPSRRLELMHKQQQRGDGGADNGVFQAPISFDCSWSDILTSICNATGLQSPSDISHLIPRYEKDSPDVAAHNGDDLIADHFQFWAIMKRLGDVGETVVWEVHPNNKGAVVAAGQYGVQHAREKSSTVADKQDSNTSGHSIVVSVAMSTHPRVVKQAIIPTNAAWDDLVDIVCKALNINKNRQRLLHVIVFDKDGDQLTTEISSAAKFWKISAFNSTILRVYVADVGGELGKGRDRASGLSVVDGPLAGSAPTVLAGVATSAREARSGVESASESSALINVSIALARTPRKEVNVVLCVNSSWSAISRVCSKALNLDPDMDIAYMIVYDREGRKFGSPITACDRFWKNISFCSHHVFRIFTVANVEPKTTEGNRTNSYRIEMSSEPLRYKTVRYDVIPTMDDIRKSASGLFSICSDIITHVVFTDSVGDELSGALNTDSKLLKFFNQKEVNVRVFTSGPAVPVLPRFRFILEAANGPPLQGPKYISVSRTPSWEEVKMEIAEEIKLENLESVNHVVFIDDEGDELSGNVNNDIKLTKFISSSGNVGLVRMRVYLNSTETCEKTYNFFSLIADENIAELDKSVTSAVNVDKTNPSTAQSAFLFCCEHGKMESLRWLLSKKANVNQRSPDGSNGLHLAIASGQDETVNYLVAMGISVSEVDGADLTPFLLACHKGNIHAAKLLLRRGAKTSDAQKINGYQGVHLATINGNIEMLMFLVAQNGVSIESKDRSGMTPFLTSCAFGQVETAKWLVGRGCDIHACSSSGDDAGSSALHYACKGGNLELVIYLLDLGLPKDVRDAKGTTIVAKARQCNHPEIADLILDREIQGAGTLDIELFFRLLELDESKRAQGYLENFMKDVGFKYSNDDKILLFHLGCACGHMYVVEYFVIVGCDINARLGNIQATPLMQACKYGDLAMVEYLVAHGADPLMKDVSGITAMRVAVLNGHHSVAGFLDTHIKTVREKRKERQQPSASPGTTRASAKPTSVETSAFGSLFACISGMDANPTASQLFAPPPIDDDIESVEELEGDTSDDDDEVPSRHPSISGSSRSSVRHPKRLQECGGDPSMFALHSACRNGSSLGLIAVLTAAIKDLDALDDEGHTALYIACALRHWAIAAALIERGADTTVFCASVGETPLHVICHYNAVDLLRKVLQLREQRKDLAKIDINKIVDVNNSSILHAAALGNATEIVCILIDETEVDIDGTAVGARTPLHLACINKYPEVAFELIKHGADIHACDAVGGTALLYAVKANETELVQSLLDRGASVMDKTETGNTVMHIACQIGNLELAILLHNRRASLLARNDQGLTPYSYAVKCNHARLMQWIASVESKATL